jgi:predicted esterase
VALLLPGGVATSLEPTGARDLAGARMRPIATALHRGGARGGLAVWSLRYEIRGWNGEQMAPVADARWALDEIRRRHGDVPVALVGHSMGGRTAMRVADDASVVAIVGLAPWLPDGEPVDSLAGRRVLVVHGTLDRVTSPTASRRFAERAREAGATVDYVAMRGEMHAMLLRARSWHRLTTTFVLDALGLAPLPDRVRSALGRGVV